MIWKFVVGFEGLYEISDSGQVRSLDMVLPHWAGGTRLRRGKLLRARLDKDGYDKVNLSRLGRDYTRRICRLVCEAFNGPPDAPEAAHLDGNKQNNTPGNLAWKTPLDNAADRERHGTTARGFKHGNKLPAATEERTRDLRAARYTYKDIGAWLGIRPNTVMEYLR